VDRVHETLPIRVHVPPEVVVGAMPGRLLRKLPKDRLPQHMWEHDQVLPGGPVHIGRRGDPPKDEEHLVPGERPAPSRGEPHPRAGRPRRVQKPPLVGATQAASLPLRFLRRRHAIGGTPDRERRSRAMHPPREVAHARVGAGDGRGGCAACGEVIEERVRHRRLPLNLPVVALQVLVEREESRRGAALGVAGGARLAGDLRAELHRSERRQAAGSRRAACRNGMVQIVGGNPGGAGGLLGGHGAEVYTITPLTY